MPRTTLVLALAPAALLLAPASGRSGCLAPSDTSVDVGVGSGPFWGNDSGTLFYVRKGTGGAEALAMRPVTGGAEEVALGGEVNDFFVGTIRERWDTFYNGSVNASDDLAFVAATKLADDPNTPQNEAAPRRGIYARRSNTMYEIARFGNASPVVDPFNGPVPWGTFSDAVAADRDASGFLRVVFSGQLAGSSDQRSGLFRWTEQTPNAPSVAVLTGAPAPSGGAYFSFGRLRCNGAATAAFFAVTKLTPTSPQLPGLYLLLDDGSSARVVKFGTEGDPVPGGGTFAIAGDFAVDGAGAVTFAATLQGASKKTGLFRALPPLYTPVALAGEGDATPIGGTFGSFARATVRATSGGDVVFLVPLSDDIGGLGIFTIAAGATATEPLVPVKDAFSVAAMGPERAAYETDAAVRVVVPSDGSLEGPTDFRIVKLDLRNAVPQHADTIRFDGRFRLAPWGTAAPATFRGDATRFTATQTLAGAALTKIAQVKVSVSQSPGNNFVFGIGGTDTAPVGTIAYSGQPQTVKKLKVAPDGSSASWTFSGAPGPGTFSIDLAEGTFKLSVSAATIQPSYEAANFRIAFVLRSEDDVANSRPDDQSYFRRDFRINGQQPGFGKGRRVTSSGEGTPGGTVFVDTVRVARTAAKGAKPASDSIRLAGTLRMCPGTAAPSTPKLDVSLRLGDYELDATMTRLGKTSAYRYAASGVEFKLDLKAATFSLKAARAPLGQLVDAVPGSATNGAEHEVGGMELPFSLVVPRVYEASFPVPVVRLPGGKVFQR